MEPAITRSADEWFAEAARCYVEGHQACPCRGVKHCVFRTERNQRVEFYCSTCEFSACHEPTTRRYYAATGTTRRDASAGKGLSGMRQGLTREIPV
jgi:hypothetical protein